MAFATRVVERMIPQALVIGDAAAVAVMYAAAVALAFPGPFALSAAAHAPHFLFLAGCWLLAAADHEYWRVRRMREMAPLFRALAHASACAAAYSIVLMALFDAGGVQARFLAVFYGGGMAAIMAVRLAMLAALNGLHRAGCLRRRVLIVGANDRTRRLMERLRQGRQHTVIGVLDDDTDRGAAFCGDETAYLGPCHALAAVLRDRAVDDLFIGLTLRSHFETIRRLGQVAERQGLVVHLLADLFQSQHAHAQPMRVLDIPVLALSTVPENQLALATKRAVDFVGASLLLVAFSPLFLLIAVLIKMDSKGPVFFLQERAGCNQRRFRMVKFRSMVVNAEDMRRELAAQNEVDGPAFKLKADPRVTRIGAFMRKHSIDELPQLINVWKGEMSLVGPRPAVAADAERYTLGQRRRLSVKQGMTGLWQVSGRHGLSFDEWLRLDLGYIDSWSLLKDFIILLKTFREVVQGKNAA
jgi:exopolysaccharide biosynthesis polyprenyl glycosylphosphotransferase